jgi:hypothetical protein
MQIAVTTWPFAVCSLREPVAVADAPEFAGFDLGSLHDPAIDKRCMVGDSERYGTEIRTLGLPVGRLFHRFGERRTDRSLADVASAEANLRDFAAVLCLCSAATLVLVMLLPGVVNLGQTRSDAIEAEICQLRPMVDLATETTKFAAVEPRVGAAIDTLDALRPGALQTPLDATTIEFRALLSGLQAAGHRGAAVVECVHQERMGSLYEDMLIERIAMRDLVCHWGHA